jgi:hypothetical protein
MNEQMNLLKSIEQIYNRLEDSALSEDALQDLHNEIEHLATYLKVTRDEAVFFAIVFTFQIFDDTCDYRTLTRYLRVSEFKALEYAGIIEQLVQRKFCVDDRKARRRHGGRNRAQYSVNSVLFNAIIENRPFPQKELYEPLSTVEWLEHIRTYIGDDLEYVDNRELNTVIEEKLNTESESNIHKWVKQQTDEPIHQLFLVYAIWEGMTKSELYFCPDNYFTNLPKHRLYLFKEKRLLVNGSHPLILKNILETQPAQFANDIEVGLSEKICTKLKEFGIDIQHDSANPQKKVSYTHHSIKPKTLHYNEEEERQLAILTNLLQQDNFSALQTRMAERGLPTGVAALLFGSPGTGKTESVLQLARLTGRDVIQVDISESKSMWFGQSEKIVKRIFTDYKQACAEREVKPILFINEADAVLGTRRSGDSNVRQTENAIQNILLEEMEKLEGILLATTNLEVNLDSAFDRRFLFKVKFQKPGLTQRTEIWKDKLPHYPAVFLHELAAQFHLSGGQIDNIVRKTEIDYVLNGDFPKEEQLLAYCKDELALVKSVSGNRIGF